jgi:hypothetical protein
MLELRSGTIVSRQIASSHGQAPLEVPLCNTSIKLFIIALQKRHHFVIPKEGASWYIRFFDLIFSMAFP